MKKLNLKQWFETYEFLREFAETLIPNRADFRNFEIYGDQIEIWYEEYICGSTDTDCEEMPLTEFMRLAEDAYAQRDFEERLRDAMEES